MSYIIKIGSQADTSGFDKVTAAEKRATEAGKEFIDTLKMGVGIDIGGRLVNSIAQIPAFLKAATDRGLEFNETMDDATVGISNVLAKFLDLDKVAAKREAAKAIERIKEIEPEAAGGLSDLVQGFMATVAASQGVGISVEDNITLVGKFANALANTNLPVQQLGQEMRSILTGNITQDSSLAKILEISNEDIARVKQSGDMVAYLTGKLGSLGDAGDSAAVRWSTFQSAIDKALGDITKPIYDELQRGIVELTTALKDPAAVQSLREMGFEISHLVKDGVRLTEWAIANAPALAQVAKGATMLGVALAAIKVAQIISGLAAWTLGLGTSTVALDAETAALARNTAAQGVNAAARAAGAVVANAAGSRPIIYGANPGQTGLPASSYDMWDSTRQVATGGGSAAAGAAGGGLLSRMLAGGRAAINRIPTLAAAALAVGAGGVAADRIGSTIAAGGEKSSQADMDRAAAQRDQTLQREREIAQQIDALKTTADRDALLQSLAKEINQAVQDQRPAGLGEELISGGRSATNNALSDHAMALSKFIDAVKNKDGLVPASDSGQSETAKQEAERAKTQAEENRKLQDEYVAERLKKQQADAVTDAISKASDQRNPQALDDLIKNIDAKLGEATKTAANANSPNYKDALEAQGTYIDQLKQLREARLKIEEDAAAYAKEQADEENKKRIAALEDQKALVEAIGKKQLADVDASSLSEDEKARRRLQIEDEIAAKRLGIENEIGALQEESAEKRLARETQYEAEKTQRTAQAAQASAQAAAQLQTGPDSREGRIDARTGVSRDYGLRRAQYGTGGQLIGGYQNGRRLGDAEVAAINDANRPPSALDQYKADQPGMPGYTPIVTPAQVPPPAATPGAQAPGQAGQSPGGGQAPGGQNGGGQSGIDAVTKAVNEQAEKQDAALKQVASAVDSAGGKILGSINNLEERVRALEQGQ